MVIYTSIFIYFSSCKKEFLIRVFIGLFCSVIVPIIASTTALKLFDKGNGLINFIDLHLLAWIILFIITITLISVTNGLIIWMNLEYSDASKKKTF